MEKPAFIVIEGVDGSGKTYLAQKITDWLNKKEKDSAICTSEPYDREILKRVEDLPTGSVNAFYKDRIYHYNEVIGPALSFGKHVVCDRYQLSSFVNQNENETMFTFIWNKYAFYVLPFDDYMKSLESEDNKDPDWLIIIDADADVVGRRLLDRGEPCNTKQIKTLKWWYVEAARQYREAALTWMENDVHIIIKASADEAFEEFRKRWADCTDGHSEE